MNKKLIYRLLGMICLAAGIILLAVFVRDSMNRNKADKLYDKISEQVVSVSDNNADTEKTEESAATVQNTNVSEEAADVNTEIQDGVTDNTEIEQEQIEDIENEDSISDDVNESEIEADYGTEDNVISENNEAESSDNSSNNTDAYSVMEELRKKNQLEINWDELKSINSDIYAWIYVPGTKVNYPIVQRAGNSDYYLDHNLDGSKGYPGAIYTQDLNSKDFNDTNTVIYGHNMKNGSMFASLHYFEDSKFFDENRYVYIYTEKETYIYKIYAAVVFNNKHILKSYKFNSYSSFSRFIKAVDTSKSMNNNYASDVDITPEDKLITLSTCISGMPDNRWIVIAVRQ